jgi:N-acetylglucosamine-6-phosphate deacetylase
MELVIEDGVFVTMAADAGSAEAMLIRDGRIAVIGDTETVRAAAPGAGMVRLGGATVIPGLIDAHCHVADVGYLAAAADCGQSSAPDIPAIAETLKDFEASQWYGLVAPAGTPRPVIEKLNKTLQAALASDEVKKQLGLDGTEITPETKGVVRDAVEALGCRAKLLRLRVHDALQRASVVLNSW